MKCFEELIGISEGCSPVVPASGFYLDRVGIGLDELSAWYNKPFVNGKDFGNKQIEFAGQILATELNQNFQHLYRTNSLLDSQRVGFFAENLNLQNSIAGSSKGISIEICNTTSFVNFFLSEIETQFEFTGNVNIEVWDLFENKLLDTIVVASVAGEIVSTSVYKTYQSRRRDLNIVLIYDSTFDSYKSTTKFGGCSSCGAKSGFILNRYITARGITIENASPKIKNSLKGFADTGGISLNYNVNCNHEEWLCANKNLLALPLLWKSAFVIFQFARDNSKQTNTSTMVDRDKLESSMNNAEKQYNEAMQDVLAHMKVPDDEKCYQCERLTKYVTTLPG